MGGGGGSGAYPSAILENLRSLSVSLSIRDFFNSIDDLSYSKREA